MRIMKSYKLFRWLLRASALTTVMFVMQACYGSPNPNMDVPDPQEMNDETLEPETLVSDTLAVQNSL
jgi:hypothetical protein